jgi:hypothetical protein
MLKAMAAIEGLTALTQGGYAAHLALKGDKAKATERGLNAMFKLIGFKKSFQELSDLNREATKAFAKDVVTDLKNTVTIAPVKGGSHADDLLLPRPSHTHGHGFTVRDINPTGDTLNCLECTIRVDDLLAGNRPLAAAARATEALDYSILERIYGRQFSGLMSADEVTKVMNSGGMGSRGIVFGIPEKITDHTIGHFFNVANQKGVVRFLDGQAGGAADPSKFYRFRILRTN